MCPRDGYKLDVVRNCFRCRHYAHTSYSGNVAYIACCYPKTAEGLMVEEERRAIGTYVPTEAMARAWAGPDIVFSFEALKAGFKFALHGDVECAHLPEWPFPKNAVDVGCGEVAM